MTFSRETLRSRRTADYEPNTLTVDSDSAWYVRYHYRRLRRSGATLYASRAAVWDMLFQASMRPPVFTAGNAAEVAS